MIEDGYDDGDLDDEIADEDIEDHDHASQSSPPDLDQDVDLREAQDLDDDVPDDDASFA